MEVTFKLGMHKPVNIIIPMAGHSRRFKAAGYQGPKAFLRVGNKMMIEHVISMFDQSDYFHFVINESQDKENPEYKKILQSLAKRVSITVIKNHELGPTYSAIQVKEIESDEEVIISYCDFFVEWDYSQFLRNCQGVDAAIPSFRGFHPASFGDTYYAYLRVKGNRFLELREKKSFTEKRHEEHASAGIYYFKSWSFFTEYAEKLLEKDKMELPEAYTSLIFNPIKDDGHEVLIYEVKKFICLGTPEDLEQYNFWYSYFEEGIENHQESHYDQINLIPIAGAGSRFKKVGYRVVKPLIQIQGESMVIKSARGNPSPSEWIFLVQKDDLLKHPVKKSLNTLSGRVNIVEVNGLTSGQAATCLLAKEKLNKDIPLLIASGDYQTVFDHSLWDKIYNDKDIDGVIWTTRLGPHPVADYNAFAYCEVDSDGISIKRVVEKRTISDCPQKDPMVVGTFWYRNAKDFVDSAEEMISKNITVNNEHYVGTSINRLIGKGKKFIIFDIKQWISFGDPIELNFFEYWEEFFYTLRNTKK